MHAAWYEKQGAAQDVLVVGEMPDPTPAAGELRIRIAASGINPGDVKKLDDTFGVGMPYPRIIPHSDGAGVVDRLGEGVPQHWLGQRVWCFGAQSYRPFGTAAEFTCVPLEKVAPLPENVSFEQGACIGIPGITAHRSVFVGGPVAGKVVLVQGAGGAVGMCAVQLARRGGAQVIGTVRSAAEEQAALTAGAHSVLYSSDDLVSQVRTLAPEGVDHIVEVAFAANIAHDVDLLKNCGSLATYATNDPAPLLPFWPMVFNNNRVFFLGSDDFPAEAKTAATIDLNAALSAGWPGFPIGERLPLAQIAQAHELVHKPTKPGRVVIIL